MTQKNISSQSGQPPLFEITDSGYSFPEHATPSTAVTLNPWNKFLTNKTAGFNPECKSFYKQFQQGLPPLWHVLINQVGKQLSSQTKHLQAGYKPIFETGCAYIEHELAWENYINRLPGETYQPISLNQLPVSERIAYDASGTALFRGLNSDQLPVFDASMLKELTELQLLVLEQFVQPVVNGQRTLRLPTLLQIVNADVLTDIYHISDIDRQPKVLEPGNRAAYIKLHPKRLLELKPYELEFAYEGNDDSPIEQRRELDHQRRKGSNGFYVDTEVQRNRLSAASSIGKMLHEAVYQGINSESQQNIAALQVLLKGYHELADNLKIGGSLLPEEQIKAALNDPSKDIKDSKIWQTLRTTAKIFSRLYLHNYLTDNTGIYNEFGNNVATYLGQEAEQLVDGGAEFQEGIFSQAINSNEQLQALWDKRPKLKGKSAIAQTTIFTNLLRDIVKNHTGVDMSALAKVYPDANEVMETIDVFADVTDANERFNYLETELTNWIINNHKNDLVRQMYGLMILAEIIHNNPLKAYSNHIFTEVRLPANGDENNNYVDAIVLPDLASKDLLKRGANVVDLLNGYAGKVKIVEIKTINKEHGDHKRRKSPRVEDLQQMNRYLERIKKLFPNLATPEIDFMYISLEGTSIIHAYPNCFTGQLEESFYARSKKSQPR